MADSGVSGYNDFFDNRVVSVTNKGCTGNDGWTQKYENINLALAAYNAGGGAVDKSLRRTGDIPPSTKQYINKIYKYKEVIREFS